MSSANRSTNSPLPPSSAPDPTLSRMISPSRLSTSSCPSPHFMTLARISRHVALVTSQHVFLHRLCPEQKALCCHAAANGRFGPAVHAMCPPGGLAGYRVFLGAGHESLSTACSKQRDKRLQCVYLSEARRDILLVQSTSSNCSSVTICRAQRTPSFSFFSPSIAFNNLKCLRDQPHCMIRRPKQTIFKTWEAHSRFISRGDHQSRSCQVIVVEASGHRRNTG